MSYNKEDENHNERDDALVEVNEKFNEEKRRMRSIIRGKMRLKRMIRWKK